MKIITGYKGEAHITSNEIQGENQGIFGTGSYVMNVGNKFSPTLISANELQISDGEGVIQGVHFRVDPGTYDSVTIENGAQGMNRKDLVVCRYTKDAETGVEQTEWVVKKGTATSGTATRPSATSGNIRTGSTLAEMAMFEIVLSGINVTAVNPLFSVLKSMKELMDLENELNTNTTTTFTASLSSVSSTITIKKLHKTVVFNFELGNGTAFSSAIGINEVATVPSGYRPDTYINVPLVGRTDGSWATATYYQFIMVVKNDGTININGNQSNLRACKYLMGYASYPVS